jgi:hypothetical protein
MKRTLAILLATLLLTVSTLSAPAEAARACADINGSSVQSYYVVDGPGNAPDEALLSIQITTVNPLCSNATLTVFLSTDGNTFTAYTYRGDSRFSSCGDSCLTFTYDYESTDKAKTSTAPPTVYVYLETTIGGGTLDRAPDNGAPAFLLCDFDPKTKNFDNTGTVIPPCNPPGGNYFQ